MNPECNHKLVGTGNVKTPWKCSACGQVFQDNGHPMKVVEDGPFTGITDSELRKKLATSRFDLGRVYKRKTIQANCDKWVETSRGGAALVKAHAEPWCDVVFEFAKVSGKKFECFGVGRAEYFPMIT